MPFISLCTFKSFAEHYPCVQVLVSGLANSKTFQRFAVKSNDMFQEMSKKGVEGRSRYADQLSEFSKTFKQEMQKGMDEQFGKGSQKRP